MLLGKRQPALSRSEQIRQRRNQELEKRQVIQPVEEKPAPVYPFFSRTHLPGVTTNRKPEHLPRRAMYYQNRKTGAEVRLPSVPSVKPGWRFLSGVLAFLMLGLIVFVFVSGNLQVSKVIINGLQRLNSLEIETALDLGGKPVVAVDTKAIAHQLARAYPELANIRVRLVLPSTVAISTYERVPLMTWATNELVFWIDMEGTIFPARGDVTPPLYIVSNELPPLAVVREKVKLGSSQKFVPELLDMTIMGAIRELSSRMPLQTQFVYSTQDGLGWVDQRGWAVFVGVDFSDLSVKINEYQAIAEALDQQGIRPVMVSVEDVDAPFFRTE